MSASRVLQCALVIAGAAGVAACGSGQSGHTMASSGAPPAGATSGQHYQANIALEGHPQTTADGKDIVVTVRVTNTGTGTFGSASQPPVNLGAHSIDSAGKVVNNDVSRGKLPLVAKGAAVTATIRMPVDQLMGKRAEILPVEEGVAWFDQWSPATKPLIVGPFQACGNASEDNVCDAAGKPLPVAAGNP